MKKNQSVGKVGRVGRGRERMGVGGREGKGRGERRGKWVGVGRVVCSVKVRGYPHVYYSVQVCESVSSS